MMTGVLEGPVHFVGIGGAGQRAAAELLLGWGIAVQGSDVQTSEALMHLAGQGARVFAGHAAEHLGAAKLMVVSSAIPEDNPEVKAARQQGVPVIKNAELERLIGVGRRTLAVAGTHGKTTTTSMLAWALTEAGFDPVVLAGGEMSNLGSSGRPGRGAWFVVEADEYDGRFLQLEPWCAIVLNVEPDHLDYYGSIVALTEAFEQLVARPPHDGRVVLCVDDPGAERLTAAARAPVETYGLMRGRWRTAQIEQTPEDTRFAVLRDGEWMANCRLHVPGLHNVRNALACFAGATAAGVTPERIAAALEGFRGARRRFDLMGEAGGVVVLNDYGHHPTEIRATLEAARQRYPGRHLWLVFQPHTYARTRLLFEEFVTACQQADTPVIVGTYVPPGRERPEEDALTRQLAERISAPYVGEVAAVAGMLRPLLQSGDVVLLVGAGDVRAAGRDVLAALGQRA